MMETVAWMLRNAAAAMDVSVNIEAYDDERVWVFFACAQGFLVSFAPESNAVLVVRVT